MEDHKADDLSHLLDLTIALATMNGALLCAFAYHK